MPGAVAGAAAAASAAAGMLPAQEAAKLYHTNYVRNSRAIGVLWAIFTSALPSSTWCASSSPTGSATAWTTPQAGYFGLFHYCIGNGFSRELTCRGSFTDFSSLPAGAFKAASFFIGLSMTLIIACIVCFTLFFFCNTATVYKICAWMQLTSGESGAQAALRARGINLRLLRAPDSHGLIGVCVCVCVGGGGVVVQLPFTGTCRQGLINSLLAGGGRLEKLALVIV
uniref:LHFPL tetraspan subfamily member 3 n=1 Tax=Gopherus evgoodei TaxID=1825980 RepID=A0A8C4XXH4_9SAUR